MTNKSILLVNKRKSKQFNTQKFLFTKTLKGDDKDSSSSNKNDNFADNNNKLSLKS